MATNMTTKERRDMIIYLYAQHRQGTKLIWTHESIYLSQSATYKRMRTIARLRISIARKSIARYELAQKLTYQNI